MVILAALPGMVRELLVTGNLVKPGNFSVSVNFLGYRIRKVGLVASTYVESLNLVKGELEEEEIAPVWGVFRRGKIEGGLRTLAERYGLEARAERNPSGSFHTVIESEHFCMTESRVLEASRVPKRALFREIRAVNNYPLFASIE